MPRVILWQGVRELYSLYVYIDIFVQLFLQGFSAHSYMISNIPMIWFVLWHINSDGSFNIGWLGFMAYQPL